ncbi:hypothetical protein FC14_GL000750 [Ligilactobacillus agilis DSM 20509]|uniref:Uncharacterized protein n=1 Tax=Ligilactobacillus agilis DSM 20509 TaxID=1423718 RepID=A0A0R2AFY7_9LACO|nr:hypothetical protein FC14_GL000750 [Ligilactobacillus agilis DSM 20509]
MIKKFTYKLFLTLATSLLLLTSLCLTSPLTTRNHLHKQLVAQPTLYFHGWAGSANSTNHLIAAAAALPQAKKVLTITVTESGQLAINGSWQDNVKYPLIQVLFANNQAEIPQQARWIDKVVTSNLTGNPAISSNKPAGLTKSLPTFKLTTTFKVSTLLPIRWRDRLPFIGPLLPTVLLIHSLINLSPSLVPLMGLSTSMMFLTKIISKQTAYPLTKMPPLKITTASGRLSRKTPRS